LNKDVVIKVEDQDLFYHDKIGETSISLQKFIQNTIEIYPLHNNSKDIVGQIIIETMFIEK